MYIKIVPIHGDHKRINLYEGTDIRCDVYAVSKEEDQMQENGDRQVIRECPEANIFNENLDDFVWYETVVIRFWDTSGEHRIIEAPMSTVFIMNADGKTIDRINTGFATENHGQVIGSTAA